MKRKLFYTLVFLLCTHFFFTHINGFFPWLFYCLSEQNSCFGLIFNPFLDESINLDNLATSLTIISRLLNIFIAFSGLLLGAYYFFSKMSYDEKNAKIEKKNNRLDLIIEHLNLYDSFVSAILRKDFSNQIELGGLRDKIDRSYEMVEALLEANDKLLNFSESELTSFSMLNSYIDQSDQIMEIPFTELIKDDLYQSKQEYITRIKKARMVCLNNME